MNDGVRGYWSHLQGLDGGLRGASAHDVLVRTGWMRSVGGAGPYLGLHARAGLTREACDAALAAGEICELPSARGCTYVVPRADYAVALRAGQGKGDEAAIATARKACGVTDAELATLCTAVLDALESGPMEPADIKAAVGSAVRHLGEAGKKKGMTTTLPLALGRLQSHGRIRRIPPAGRIDQQRYAYAAWSPSPLDGVELSDDALAFELARRYWRWIGIATVDQFAWWSGLTKKACKAAVAELGLVAIDDALATAEAAHAVRSFRAPKEPDVRLVGSLDNLFHLRREVGPLVHEDDRGYTLAGGGFSTASTAGERVSTVLDLPHHAVVDRGRLIGLWDFDADLGTVAVRLFCEPAGAAAAIRAAEGFVREELGDARAFSLDAMHSKGPGSRKARLVALRG